MLEREQYHTLVSHNLQAAFLDHVGGARLGGHVAHALRAHVEQMQRVPFDRLLPLLSATKRRCKQGIAQLIAAACPDEVVLLPNAVVGMNSAATSLPLEAGDNVLLLQGDAPDLVYPWVNLAPRGVGVRWLPPQNGALDPQVVAQALDRHTRVLALSSAILTTGSPHDLVALGALCQQHKLFFVVDGSPTLGASPFDVQQAQIDILVCDGHRWLLGTPGSGFLYCRRELQPQLQLGAYVGAYSVVNPYNYLDYNFTLRTSAERFAIGSTDTLALVALDAALGLLLEVGMEVIRQQITDLTDVLRGDLRERGLRVRGHLPHYQGSPIVVVDHPAPQAAHERLLANGVIGALAAHGLRFSPHFYNSEAEVLRVGAVLGNSQGRQ